MTPNSERPSPQAVCTVPPPPTPARPRTPARPWTAVLAAGALAAVVAGVVVLGGQDSTTPENSYRSVGSTGEYPFMSPVGADESVLPVMAGGARRGDSPGLYQQDPERLPCDGAALTGRLEMEPARADAWARVQRVAPGRVTEFVAGLTPVVLRGDTAVVDHGYRDGRAVPTRAVLAAGTAVFLDGHGVPVVGCRSGDPLTPGSSTDPSVTTVDPTAVPITTVTVLDPTVERLVERPTGSRPPPPSGDTGVRE